MTQAGAYIAAHPWLDIVRAATATAPGAAPYASLFKVGHSGNLARRLTDDAYTTCFPPGWRYIATLETKTKEAAEKIEGAILAYYRNFRLEKRELVFGHSAEAIIATGVAVAKRLGIDAKLVETPVYVDNTPRRVCAEPVAEPVGDVSCDDIYGAWAPPEKTKAVPAPAAAVAAPAVAVAAPAVAVAAPPIEDRQYQTDAIEQCVTELARSQRAILQMACRCGKTKIAYGVINAYIRAKATCKIVYFVPSLTLLRQTAEKLAAYAAPMAIRDDMLLVGSDAAGGRMTTDPAEVRRFLAAGGPGRPRIVICMYQSSPQLPVTGWGLAVFDEAHRICGGMAPRLFNHALLKLVGGDRLFMTATPAYDKELSMKDRRRFGGVAYRYYLREGINANYVNDFRLELVEGDSLPSQILTAMGRVDKLLVFCNSKAMADSLCREMAQRDPTFECLVAHSGMSKPAQLEVLRKFEAPGGRAALFNCKLFQEGVEIPALNGVFFASPRHSPRDIIQSLCRPLNAVPGKPQSVIFIPVTTDPTTVAAKPAAKPAKPAAKPIAATPLVSAAEISKRYADIIPIFDALIQEDPRLFEHILDPDANPYPLSAIGVAGVARPGITVAVRRAVRYGSSTAAHPPERLLRTENIPWAVGFGELQRVVLECGHYPKTTDGFTIGKAKINFHRYYRWCADQYAIHAAAATARGLERRLGKGGAAALCLEYAGVPAEAGKALVLEPHQLAELAKLPGWEPYGVEGPYPWDECLTNLDAWLTAHGEPPMVEINKGGYVGLEASPIERISGMLTCINQADGKARQNSANPLSGFIVSEAKQRDLDALCAKHKLRWRKERAADGELLEGGEPTFIQKAYARFKAYYADMRAGKNDGAFIKKYFADYPRKHARQMRLDVAKASIPTRWKVLRRKK